jgi:hypothetical protein
MLIPVTYILMYVLGGALRPGYNHISDSVSELLSPGAPNKSLLSAIQIVYALLHVLFGIGVLQFVQASEHSALIGIIGAGLIVAVGVATVGTAIFPQDATGTPPTLPGQLHKILVFGALVPFSFLSIGRARRSHRRPPVAVHSCAEIVLTLAKPNCEVLCLCPAMGSRPSRRPVEEFGAN